MSLGDDITLADLEVDPDPIMARLRADEPVCWVPALEMWLVTRWDDVAHMEEHPELFTAATEPSSSSTTCWEYWWRSPARFVRFDLAMISARRSTPLSVCAMPVLCNGSMKPMVNGSAAQSSPAPVERKR